MKSILISGVQPSGKIHIGNYVGALKNFVDLQDSDKYQCYFFIADLHALTEDLSPKDLNQNILDLMADFLAAGLDPQKSVIFQQSQIHGHSELAWILNTITPMGELSRMTQFKEKSENQTSNVNVGLFSYPVLQAADIILYDAKFVPVGHDQLQHLELTRTLARKFNKKFGKTFIEPQPVLTKTPRIMSLLNPEKKMSKSQPEGCLFIDDSEKEIKSKIKKAVTDSGSEIKYDKKTKPAVSNLLEIYSALSGESFKELESKFSGMSYSDFKEDLINFVSDYFADFRGNKSELLKNKSKLISILTNGSQKASIIANNKISEIRKKVGLN